jgi:hypothetical protein
VNTTFSVDPCQNKCNQSSNIYTYIQIIWDTNCFVRSKLSISELSAKWKELREPAAAAIHFIVFPNSHKCDAWHAVRIRSFGASWLYGRFTFLNTPISNPSMNVLKFLGTTTFPNIKTLNKSAISYSYNIHFFLHSSLFRSTNRVDLYCSRLLATNPSRRLKEATRVCSL